MSKLEEQTLPLEWCQLHFDIAPYNKMKLLPYPASAIRGGLGYALKEDCKQSELYNLLYEEQEGVKEESGYMAYNRPMIIRTRNNNKMSYIKGEVYSFEIILFGEVIQHYKAIIRAMEQFGQAGIGKDMDRFFVQKVVAKSPIISKVIYDDGEWVGSVDRLFWGKFTQLSEMKPTRVEIDFKTPVKLKVNGEYQADMTFEQFVENLSRKVSSLIYFHQPNTRWDDGYVIRCKEQANLSNTLYQDFYPMSYDRFSTRQNKKIALEGIKGKLIVEGEIIKTIFPLLYVGQFCHVGKQSLFGLGEYELTIYE